MAGIVNNKPNLKKTYAGFKRVDNASEAKKTTHLSDEFKEQINEVSGQNKANATPVGKQAGAVDKMNRKRGSGTNDQISSLEG